MRVATAFYGLFFSTKCRKNTVLLRVGLFESCYGFLRFFFQQIVEQIRFCHGVGLQCSFDLQFFLVITGKNNILPKNDHYGFFPIVTRKCCVFGFPGI